MAGAPCASSFPPDHQLGPAEVDVIDLQTKNLALPEAASSGDVHSCREAVWQQPGQTVYLKSTRHAGSQSADHIGQLAARCELSGDAVSSTPLK